MSVPCTFFVMSHASLKGRDFSRSPNDAATPFYGSGGLSEINIAELESLFTGVSFQSLLNERGVLRSGVWDGGDEGPWVYELSSPLVTALAKASPASLKTIATKWGGGAFQEAVLVGLLGALGLLAVNAVETKRSLYWWVSL